MIADWTMSYLCVWEKLTGPLHQMHDDYCESGTDVCADRMATFSCVCVTRSGCNHLRTGSDCAAHVTGVSAIDCVTGVCVLVSGCAA